MASEAMWATQNGDVKQLKDLTFDANEIVKGRTLLHIAADYGQHEVIEYLVEEKNANVNAVDTYGISVLLAAIYGSEGQERYKTCIKYLLEKNADKTAKTPDGASFIEATEDEEIKQLLR